jgi:hypothetical protein
MEIRIIDLHVTKKSEIELNKICNVCKAYIEDWMEKDYGIEVYINVPERYVHKFIGLIKYNDFFQMNN